MECLCSIWPWQAEQDDLTVSSDGSRRRASMVYIASISNTPHPYIHAPWTLPGLTVHTARRQRSQGLLARTPARVRAGDPVLWERMRAGVPALVWTMSWAWEVWRVADSHDSPSMMPSRQRPAGWHEPGLDAGATVIPKHRHPGPLLAAASVSLLGTERSRREVSFLHDRQ